MSAGGGVRSEGTGVRNRGRKCRNRPSDDADNDGAERRWAEKKESDSKWHSRPAVWNRGRYGRGSSWVHPGD